MNNRIPLPNCLDLFTLSLHSSKGNRMTDLDIWRNFDCNLNIIKKVFWKRLFNCIDTFLFAYSCHSLVTCCLILLVGESYVGKQHILLQWWEASSSLVSLPCVDTILNILQYPEGYISFCTLENKPLAYVVTKFMQNTTRLSYMSPVFWAYHLWNPKFGSNFLGVRIYCSKTENTNLKNYPNFESWSQSSTSKKSNKEHVARVAKKARY